jgi:hypothetical protein
VLQLVCAAILGNPRYSAAQVHTRLNDISAAGSPVRISGQAAFRDDHSQGPRYGFEANALAMNVSRKSILLFVMHFEVKGPTGPSLEDNYQQDYFFVADPLRPGGVEDVGLAPLRISSPMVNGELATETMRRAEPDALVTLEFVQFSDGSTWGDAQSATGALNARQQTLRELALLEQIYSQAGEQEFMANLSKPSVLESINALKSECDGDSRCSRDAVHKMILVARDHEMQIQIGASVNSAGMASPSAKSN